jgi:metal-responsive CopG/Arc/MetJ family transcriptional regulator
MEKKQITVQLEDGQIKQLDALEKSSGIGRQVLIRLAIRHFLAKQETKPENNAMNHALKAAGLK